ncbi:MAG: AI-2E family transporter [Clostridia bacterium]|nr:AI-2E family transporter [Clostridia bacterium]
METILGLIGKFFHVLTPFFVGILLAYLLYIPCEKIERLLKKSKLKLISKKARGFSILIVYVVVIILITIVINFIVPVLIESITSLVTNIQGYYENTIIRFNELPEDSWIKSEKVKEIISNIQGVDLKQYLNLDNIAKYAKNALGFATSIFDIFVAIIVSIYAISERTQIVNFFKELLSALFKKNPRRDIQKYFNNTNVIFSKFIGAQILDAIIVGILTTIAMSIMKIEYAPLLGFMIGLFNIIPYFGAIIAIAICAIITLMTGGLSQALWMLVVVIVLQQIDSNIINPKIIGGSLKISPLLVIFSVTLGGAYFGVVGMFLAVPVAAVIKIWIEDYIEFKKMEGDFTEIRDTKRLKQNSNKKEI